MTSDSHNKAKAGFHIGDDLYRQRFTVGFEYPVYFTRGVLDPGNNVMDRALNPDDKADAQVVQVFIDGGLALARPELADTVAAWFKERAGIARPASAPQVLPGGEAAKRGWGQVSRVMRLLGGLHLDRQAIIIGIGGGAMLDMLGLAAALVHRGLKFLRLPSTTLSQCDAAVGVKNGVDLHGMKNFAGTFAPPFAVIADSALLATLSQRDWIGGVAEAFKVAMIKDAGLFDFLCDNAPAIAARDPDLMTLVVRRCARIHLDHIRSGGDPFETGSARPLDFGHWAAHRIECMSDYRIGHGQAVAIGIAIDSHYALQTGLINGREFERLLDGLTACGLPIWDQCVDQRDACGSLMIEQGLEDFREHLGGRLTVTLPEGIGARREVHTVSQKGIVRAVEALRRRA